MIMGDTNNESIKCFEKVKYMSFMINEKHDVEIWFTKTKYITFKILNIWERIILHIRKRIYLTLLGISCLSNQTIKTCKLRL